MLQEHAFYQPVSLAAAYALAGRQSGVLATLADDAYQKGMALLAAAVHTQGGQTLIGSEVTLVEVAAVKDEQPRPKRRKRPFDPPAGGAGSELAEAE